jgi:hypothetical protein
VPPYYLYHPPAVGVAAGAGAAQARYAMGVNYAALQPGATAINENGQTCYIAGSVVFRPMDGANSVTCKVVPAP